MRDTSIAGTGPQPWSASSRSGPFTARPKRLGVRRGRSRKRRNSRSLLPSTSSKLSVRHVITVVNRSRAAGASVRQSSVTTGCHVFCQRNSPVGTSQPGVPMLAPNVNRWSNPRKKSTYQGTPLAIASWVKTGSESMNTRRGMRAYSSRQNQVPPDRLISRSASAQYARTASFDRPWYAPS